MNETARDQRLRQLVVEALLSVSARRPAALTDEHPLAELFPDSLTAVAFAAELEDRLGQEIPFDQWLTRNAPRMATLTLDDLVRFVRDAS